MDGGSGEALAYRWDGRRARLYFQTRPGTYNEESLIEFVRELRRHFSGQQVILLWDGLPSHRSRRMQEFLSRQGRWLQVERLPAYAPELNPAEGLWANLKGRELATAAKTRSSSSVWRPEWAPAMFVTTRRCSSASIATLDYLCDAGHRLFSL